MLHTKLTSALLVWYVISFMFSLLFVRVLVSLYKRNYGSVYSKAWVKPELESDSVRLQYALIISQWKNYDSILYNV